jgi:hypothetical protein
MVRPQAQVSTYIDTSGKPADLQPGVQEPIRPKKADPSATPPAGAAPSTSPSTTTPPAASGSSAPPASGSGTPPQ